MSLITEPTEAPSIIPSVRLGDYLVEQGVLTRQALSVALAEQSVAKEPLGTILVRNGLLSYRQLVDYLLTLAPEQIASEQIVTSEVPNEIIQQFGIVMVAELEDALYLSTLAPEETVQVVLSEYYPGKELRFLPFLHEPAYGYLGRLEQMHGSVGGLAEKVVRDALAIGASDIHILPKTNGYSLMVRYLGVRQHYHEGPLEEYHTLIARVKDRARMDLAESGYHRTAGFAFSITAR